MIYKLFTQFASYDAETQSSNIMAWSPVIESILIGFTDFQDSQFEEQIPYFYGYFVKLLKSNHVPFYAPLSIIFEKVGKLYHIAQKTMAYAKEIEVFPSLESLHNDFELDTVAEDLVAAVMDETVATLELESRDPFANPSIQ